MRILFAGTPDIAVPCLEALASVHAVEVLTNPDAPAGRGGRATAPPVKLKALSLGLTVHQPAELRGEARASLEGRFDLLVSFAYGKIFGPRFLALFPLGGLNVHPSLLPRWRGPSPLTAAILARDPQTGISVQRLAEQMDAGDVMVRSVRPLDGTETTASLTSWAAEASPPLLLRAIASVEAGVPGESQNPEAATYCSLLSKEEGVLDWARSATELHAQARAFDPWPGVFSSWRGERLVVRGTGVLPGGDDPPGTVSVDKSKGILVQTGDGLLVVRELQLPARKSMDFRSFLNGNPGLVGSRLGES